MKRITIREFEKKPRSEILARHLKLLQRHDERLSRISGETVFDWSLREYIRAKSYVGVIQIPGLQVEILPKTDHSVRYTAECSSSDSDPMVRRNLLYMLGVAGNLSVMDREIAAQDMKRMSIWEALIWAFAKRLVKELRRGLHHQYIYQEENLRWVKGRILMKDQVRLNLGRSDRIYVGYEEFTPDTWLNRILKETSLRLLGLVSRNSTQQLLREALLELADVERMVVTSTTFERVHLDRSARRFEDLLEFCRMVCLGLSPSMQGGKSECFSLLFRMEEVFETFVARFIRRFADRFGFSSDQIHIQARGHQKWLVRSESDTGQFRLKPDLVITSPSGLPLLILDTKWKRLVSDAEHPRNGVNQSDIYQLYAYAHRYECPHNILLFPQVEGATPKSYLLEGLTETTRLKVGFIDLAYDLMKEQERLIQQLRGILMNSPAN